MVIDAQVEPSPNVDVSNDNDRTNDKCSINRTVKTLDIQVIYKRDYQIRSQ